MIVELQSVKNIGIRRIACVSVQDPEPCSTSIINGERLVQLGIPRERNFVYLRPIAEPGPARGADLGSEVMTRMRT